MRLMGLAVLLWWWWLHLVLQVLWGLLSLVVLWYLLVQFPLELLSQVVLQRVPAEPLFLLQLLSPVEPLFYQLRELVEVLLGELW